MRITTNLRRMFPSATQCLGGSFDLTLQVLVHILVILFDLHMVLHDLRVVFVLPQSQHFNIAA